MSVIRFFFWFLFPAPKIGEEYTFVDSYNDPWRTSYYRVIKQQGNWYRLRHSSGYEISITRAALTGFYRNVGRYYENGDNTAHFN